MLAAIFSNKNAINGEKVCFVNDNKNVKVESTSGNRRICYHMYSDMKAVLTDCLRQSQSPS